MPEPEYILEEECRYSDVKSFHQYLGGVVRRLTGCAEHSLHLASFDSTCLSLSDKGTVSLHTSDSYVYKTGLGRVLNDR